MTAFFCFKRANWSGARSMSDAGTTNLWSRHAFYITSFFSIKSSFRAGIVIRFVSNSQWMFLGAFEGKKLSVKYCQYLTSIKNLKWIAIPLIYLTLLTYLSRLLTYEARPTGMRKQNTMGDDAKNMRSSFLHPQFSMVATHKWENNPAPYFRSNTVNANVGMIREKGARLRCLGDEKI